MYLHVGNGETVRREQVVGIFDLDTSTVSQQTRAFLSRAEKDGVTVSAGGDLPKSFVLLAPEKEKPTFGKKPPKKKAGQRAVSAHFFRQSARQGGDARVDRRGRRLNRSTQK